MRNRRHPALFLGGTPEVLYWPRVPVEVAGEVLVPDVLLRVRTGERVDWVLVEVDEGGTITSESHHRQEILGLPTLRLTERDVLSASFVDRLVRRAQRPVGMQFGVSGAGGRGNLVTLGTCGSPWFPGASRRTPRFAGACGSPFLFLRVFCIIPGSRRSPVSEAIPQRRAGGRPTWSSEPSTRAQAGSPGIDPLDASRWT